MLKFSANLNFLFTEAASTIAGRIKLADQYGFQAVEIPYPVGELLDVAQAIKESGILISLINISIGKSKYKRTKYICTYICTCDIHTYVCTYSGLQLISCSGVVQF